MSKLSPKELEDMRVISWLQLVGCFIFTIILGVLINKLIPAKNSFYVIPTTFFIFALSLNIVLRITGVSLPQRAGNKVIKVKKGFNKFWKSVLLYVVITLIFGFVLKLQHNAYPYFEKLDYTKWNGDGDLIMFESYEKKTECLDQSKCYRLLKLFHSGRLLISGDLDVDISLINNFDQLRKLIYNSEITNIYCASSGFIPYTKDISFHLITLGQNNIFDTNRFFDKHDQSKCLNILEEIQKKIISNIN